MKTSSPLIHTFMSKNLPALRKRRLGIFLAAAFITAGSFLLAQNHSSSADTASNSSNVRWYRSNSSGMALDMINSRLAASRDEYSLSVETIRAGLPQILPEITRRYYDESYVVELRLLYEYGREIRRQWIFRDGRGIARMAASGTASFFDGDIPGTSGTAAASAAASTASGNQVDGETEEITEEESKEINRSGFIEIKNYEGFVTREFQYDNDLSEWDFRYFYRGNILLRTETWLKGPPAPAVPALSAEELSEGQEAPPQAEERKAPVLELTFTDTYRYSRSGSLRAIDRTIHQGSWERTRTGFPRIGPGGAASTEQATQGGSYSSDFFIGVTAPEGVTITYTLDTRGRVLGEIWRDESGKIIGELVNTWSGDRLQTVKWKTAEEERLIEYDFNRAGDPVAERNFRNGILERAVSFEGDNETEEIYMNGRLILRAYWENGIKVSEERIGPGGNPAGGTSP